MDRDWQKAYEDGDTPWDKGYPAPPLMEFLRTHRVRGKVLVPGCGAGHDVRALAAQGVEVRGLDIAPGALAKAKTFTPVGEESYEIGDFLDPGSEHCGAYDWVFEHTCLCALSPGQRAAYFQALAKVLKPGGQYLAIFYREVSDYTGEEPPHPISREESEGYLAEGYKLLESFIPRKTYPSRPVGSEEVCLFRKSPP